MDSQAQWKELNVTKDEVDRLGEALKDEQFRKMFVEYAEEISDPKNRELYEKEISQLENERGMDIQFIHPTPGHVIKLLQTNDTKSFINICQNEHIGKPAGEKKTKPDGKPGLHWSIPHSFSPPREDSDSKGNKCMVYDVVFHPDTYRMGTNPAFKKMLHDTAIDGLEKQFGLEFKRDDLVKLRNMKFKGRAEATVLRKKKEDKSTESTNSDNILNNFSYPYEEGVTSEDLANRKRKEVAEAKKRKEEREKRKHEANNNEINKENKDETGAFIPDYTITNQYGVDISDFGQSTSGVPLASNPQPNKLIVSLHLPLLKSAASCQLDVTERQLKLVSTEPTQYKLTLKLPHPVDDENGSAKFDKTKRRLVVTLPVIRQKLNTELTSENLNQDMTTPVAQDNPLIEELSATVEELTNEQTNTQDAGHSEVNCFTNSSIDENQPIKLDSDKIAYTFPPFTYDQDEHCVTFVLDVAHVTSCGFLTYHETNWMEMVFHTDTSTGFPSYYHLKAEFPANISSVSRNIGESNVVVNVEKAEKTETDIWESFSASCVSSSEKEIFTFLTQNHIKRELEQLEMRAKSSEEPSGQVGSDDIIVKKKNSERLTIDLQAFSSDKKNNRKSPEVIHKTSPPANMQGILKLTTGTKLNRTLSESSAGDLASEMHLEVAEENFDDHSPRERKKSVSFSDKVEQTNFKSQSSVIEMHKTLTNRKKKQRKRRNSSGSDSSDGGRRRHSSTSEYSSGDDEGGKARNRRQRRHSSSDDQLSPRKPEQNGRTSGEHEENEFVANVLEEQQEELNSDDDEEDAKPSNSAVNWDTNHEHVEQTKCAFNFSNSVIYDLDE